VSHYLCFAVPGVVSALDTLIADMEAFSGDKIDDEKARDLETKVDLLTEKLKTAFDPKTDMTNFRWSLSEPDVVHCAGCREPITSKSVLVGEETFHEACFKCFQCGVRLESRYYQVEGNNYCEADRQVALPICASCNLPLQSGSLTVNGVSFHPHCFVCSICDKPIMGKFLTREDGKYICEEDYKQSKDKCDHCGLPMLERVLTAMNKKFHPACFRCFSCDKGLDGVEFLVDEASVFCPDCYNLRKGLVCHRCGTGIVGGSSKKTTIITCESRKYHQECYQCLRCGKSLVGEHVFMDLVDKDVICRECHK